MMGTIADVCGTLPPFQTDYKPVGSTKQVPNSDLIYYDVGSSKKVIFVAYDVMGMNDNTKQTVDTLASKGFRCVMPDFYRGDGWKPENDRSQLMAWVSKVGTWDIVSRDLTTLKPILDSEGTESYGFVGFCWGGKMAMHASTLSWMKGTCATHPAWITEEDAEKSTCPVLLLPSNGEADMTPVYKVLETKPWGNKSQHVRFDDMHHGWCSARADHSNPKNARRTADAVQLMVNFFSAVLAGSKL
ncbi:hypothetical protein SmJEL517_g05915 [Synchytrium microbalum]|uniref:Dienelactone hydrolase domain-containing protein n=1 Tax=Synchytrium microbalum TaxID=1806994 RepID=A0A507BTB7_9FUNG|nr:uncharacterized protein SmJEL517_g05915 [Synchytrium microbalum]TPX30531.1 hypothetical protein SmJEL517_g05915 [Synchytrium microbalum]